MKRIVLLLTVSLFCTLSVLAQQKLPAVSDIRQAYQAFEYGKVDSLARIALDHYASYAVDELTWIHIYLGSAKFAQGNLRQARAEFSAALSLNPDIRLDPVRFSPKIIDLFEEVRKNMAPRSDANRTESAAVRYIVVRDRRIDAAWRSLLLPGWGQIYKGEKWKGRILGVAVAADLLALIYAQNKVDQAHSDYLRARKPEIIEKKYDTYKNYYRLRNGLLFLGVAAWSYSYFDALFKPMSRVTRTVNLDVRFSPTPQLSLNIRF